MDNKKTAEFVNQVWDDSIIPELCDYIKVPNKSPMFDPDWEAHGYMDRSRRHARGLGQQDNRSKA